MFISVVSVYNRVLLYGMLLLDHISTFKMMNRIVAPLNGVKK